MMDPRTPEVRDAADLGSVHVRAWQAAYRGGLMPDEYLESLSAEQRAEMWRTALLRHDDGLAVLSPIM
ncbi:MAG TPA: hypothetical protein VMO52_00495 [Acidimicrobiia bacterium]|nr:hypothetical protein [Acidimicrobiia bacterium]